MALRKKAVALALALTLPALGLPLVASGEPKAAAPKNAPSAESSSEKYDPDNIRGISQFMELVAKGMTMFQSKDTTGAIDTFRKAVQLSPRNPLGHYLLAEAYLATGNLGEAEAAIQQGLEQPFDPKAPALRAHVTFLSAVIAERQKKWEQAKTAWQAYADLAAKMGPDAGAYPATAADRMKVAQRILDLDKAYGPVRERIAAEKADAGKPKAK